VIISAFPAILTRPFVEVPLKLPIEVAPDAPVISNTDSTSTEAALLKDPFPVRNKVPELTVNDPV
jgi:hypothetical protein